MGSHPFLNMNNYSYVYIITLPPNVNLIFPKVQNSMINIEKTPEGGEDYGKRKYLKSGYRPRRLYPPNKL
jgi:hypothetical protein